MQTHICKCTQIYANACINDIRFLLGLTLTLTLALIHPQPLLQEDAIDSELGYIISYRHVTGQMQRIETPWIHFNSEIG